MSVLEAPWQKLSGENLPSDVRRAPIEWAEQSLSKLYLLVSLLQSVHDQALPEVFSAELRYVIASYLIFLKGA